MNTMLKWLFGIVLTSATLGSVANESRPLITLDALSTRSIYLVVYQRGDAWEDDKPLREQKFMREHFHYFLELHRKGVLVGGGGFTDESGGAAIFEASDDAAANAIIAADPAVQSGTFRHQLKRWKPNAWEEISKRIATER